MHDTVNSNPYDSIMSTTSQREIIFDTETTGLKWQDGDRVIEIGAIELINRFPTGRTFHEYINPQDREVHPDAEKVHGISNDDLKDKPVFSEIAEEFLAFFGDGMLVAHNASFDMGFINAELKRVDLPAIGNDRVIDTLQIARKKHPMGPNSLDALCNRYGIDNSRREKHGALLDSELLAEVYIELLGGSQASLVLEIEEQGNSDNPNGELDALEAITLRRPAPLPSRLSDEDLQKHVEFVKTLGKSALWAKIDERYRIDQD